jgi:uncharacterized protein YndB with AHSA1/START domain
MPVRKDPNGNRWVQAEVEVPGTPEEVWQAIATGPGISSWFVPTTVEEREGGAITANFGPGMESVSTITTWDSPRRFTADSDDMGPDAPTVATEWTVEARAGGTCVVRVVHRWFASTDAWDNQFEGHEQGWVAFFRILRLYLTHFRGQPCTAFQLMAMAPEPAPEAWAALANPLRLAAAAEGARGATPSGAPPLAGQVESVGPPDYPELLVRLDTPAPGLAHLFAMPMGGQVFLSLRFFLYGPDASAAAATAEATWQAWLNEHFPAAEPAPVAE